MFIAIVGGVGDLMGMRREVGVEGVMVGEGVVKCMNGR